MKKKILLAVMIIFQSACTSTQNIPINHEKYQAEKINSLIVTKHNKADFAAATAGKMAFALLGAIAMISEGNEMVEENSIEDPAILIGKALGKELSIKYSLKAHEEKEITNTFGARSLSYKYNNFDWVLNVDTKNWGFIYHTSDWSLYRITYSAYVTLIDTGTQKIIAEGYCSAKPNLTSDYVSYERLLEDNAAHIKAKSNEAANYCINEFKESVFKI